MATKTVRSLDTIKKKLAELRNMGGAVSYDRAKLIKELFDQRDWIEEEYNGDVNAARRAIQAEYLGDLAPVGEILIVIEKYPTLEAWQAKKFNVRRMYAEAMKDMPKSERHRRETMTVSEGEQLRRDLEWAKKHIKALEEQLGMYKEKTEHLTTENTRVRAENTKLRASNAELAKGSDV